MAIEHNIAHFLQETIGDMGVSSADYTSLMEKTQPILSTLASHYNNDEWPLFSLVTQDEDIKNLQTLVTSITNQFSDVIIIGTGGSSLGGQALTALSNARKSLVKLHFMDNVDPASTNELLSTIDPHSTAIISISKSGSTLETISQTLFVIQSFSGTLQNKLENHFYIITEPKSSLLRSIGESINATILPHETKLGGRYSVFSNVGVLPGLLAGLDGHSFRQGAKKCLEANLLNPDEAEAAKGAALNVSLMQQNIKNHICMAYCDRLALFTQWYRQIWAESLGKEGHGSTLIPARGTVDQHSQLQIYLDGPKDKCFTFLTTTHSQQNTEISIDLLSSQHGLQGKSIADIFQAEQQATIETLINAGLPVRTLHLPTLDEHHLGYAMMHIMLETIISAGLLGIDAFDQPAVEEGKILAKKLLA